MSGDIMASTKQKMLKRKQEQDDDTKKVKQNPSTIEDLPSGIRNQILEYVALDAPDIVSFVLVCKSWKSLMEKNLKEIPVPIEIETTLPDIAKNFLQLEKLEVSVINSDVLFCLSSLQHLTNLKVNFDTTSCFEDKSFKLQDLPKLAYFSQLKCLGFELRDQDPRVYEPETILHSWPQLNNLQNLEDFTTNCNLSLSSFPQLTKLTRLAFEEPMDILGQFALCSQLNNLKEFRCGITDDGLPCSFLFSLTSLEALDLLQISDPQLWIPQNFASFTRLTELGLLFSAPLNVVSLMTNLRSLIIQTQPEHNLNQLSTLTKLTSLHMMSTPPSDLTPITRLPLQEVHITLSGEEDQDFEFDASLSALQQFSPPLKLLRLNTPEFNDKLIQELKNLENLEFIVIDTDNPSPPEELMKNNIFFVNEVGDLPALPFDFSIFGQQQDDEEGLEELD
jgi:hypothetical protein